MYGLRALSAAARSLPVSHPQARAVELILRACWSGQPCTTSRAFSAKADDDSPGQGSKSGNARGDWRTWIEQQLSGSDQAEANEEQKVAQQQLQSQQADQNSQEAAKQSAQAEAQEEVSTQKVEEQPDAQASSPAGEAATVQSDTDASTTESILAQPSPTQQEHSATPHEPETSEGGFTPAIDVAPPAHAPSQISGLSADEKVEILLQAIRNRSWEQADKAVVLGSEDDSVQLPASGYSEIGALSEGKFQGQMLNPSRTFYPGQSYHPEDLVEDSSPSAGRAAGKVQVAPKPMGNADVLQQADFRNLDFLNKFVSEGGQIVSRRKTKLQAKVHRHVARQIKTARVMGLLPHAGRAPRFMPNKEYDLQDDDIDPNGDLDEATFVRATIADKKAWRPDQRVVQRQSASATS